MKALTIDVVADNQIIGSLEHTESYFVDWEEMGKKARQLAMELCSEYKMLQLWAEGVCLLDLAQHGESPNDIVWNDPL